MLPPPPRPRRAHAPFVSLQYRHQQHVLESSNVEKVVTDAFHGVEQLINREKAIPAVAALVHKLHGEVREAKVQLSSSNMKVSNFKDSLQSLQVSVPAGHGASDGRGLLRRTTRVAGPSGPGPLLHPLVHIHMHLAHTPCTMCLFARISVPLPCAAQSWYCALGCRISAQKQL